MTIRISSEGPAFTLLEPFVISEVTSANRRPMNLLIEETVFSALVTIWFLAGCPTSLSPFAVYPTIEGVVLCPSEFWMTVASPFSMTATHELVVPKSIPIILPMVLLLEIHHQHLYTRQEQLAVPSLQSLFQQSIYCGFPTLTLAVLKTLS